MTRIGVAENAFELRRGTALLNPRSAKKRNCKALMPARRKKELQSLNPRSAKKGIAKPESPLGEK